MDRLELFTLITAWYLSSCVAITTSKLCMQMAPVPLLLCSSQFLTATLATKAYLVVTGSPSRLGRREVTAVIRTAASYSAGFGLTNLAFSLAAASFVETVKAAEPVSTALLAAMWLGEREKTATYASLGPIVVGVALATGTDDAPVWSVATLVVIASNVCFSLRAVFVKALKYDHPSAAPARSAVVLFYHVSRFGFPAFVLAALVRGDLATLRRSDPDRPLFFAAIFANGLAYSAYNMASFMVLNKVATTTHAVLNVFRRVVVIIATTLYFATPMSLSGSIGILIAALGVTVYAKSKD